MEKVCLDCKVTKGISEFHKNRCYCKKCISIKNKLYYKSNSDKIKQVNKKWASNNKDKATAFKKAWEIKNHEVVLQRHKTYRESNKDKILEYYRINRDSYILRSRNREIAKLKRTPSWLSDKSKKHIEAIYSSSKRISECLGILHHVDHIIPLQGDLVSGLHTPLNLEVIPAKLNLQKGNKWQTY